jgi:hypothetical protein
MDPVIMDRFEEAVTNIREAAAHAGHGSRHPHPRRQPALAEGFTFASIVSDLEQAFRTHLETAPEPFPTTVPTAPRESAIKISGRQKGMTCHRVRSGASRPPA